ncbi:hypothetical protein QNA23_11115 [Rhodococcus erythropolis]|uniref:hypothetical protein n=1 Tax=Rhodococcus erythropolis TaxID=1833 RepID=UPI0024BACA4C|nr:hypothetical protein [Rhodococcus erythropolis]MDJ0404032.1 hypothetical protein [Rhodococcus erythropolis]
MATLDASSNGHNLNEYLQSSPDLAAVVDQKCAIGAAFWSANIGRDTGYASQAVRTFRTQGQHGMAGVILAFAPYAGFLEGGTDDTQGQHVLRRAIPIIEGT